jgi:hypothetical protein
LVKVRILRLGIWSEVNSESVIFMNYNIYVKTKSKTENRFDLTIDQVYSTVDAFEKGRRVNLHGNELFFAEALELRIFEYSEIKIEYRRFLDHCVKEGLTDGVAIRPVNLITLGREVTSDFIKDGLRNINQDAPYVTFERLGQINALKSAEFDFSKLVRLIEELNYAHSKSMSYSKGMLLRSIIDHVPPLFGHNDFRQIPANYSSSGNSRSFKGVTETLLRYKDSGDSILHSQIRKTESLIEPTQVNLQVQLDSLLQEIVRLTIKRTSEKST